MICAVLQPVAGAQNAINAAPTNVAQGKPISASSHTDIYVATNANGGDQGTYWESANYQFPQTLTVDLQHEHVIDQVVLKLPDSIAWETRTQTMSIMGSIDGVQFNTIVGSADYMFDPSEANTVAIHIPATTARYIAAWNSLQIRDRQRLKLLRSKYSGQPDRASCDSAKFECNG